MEQEYLSLIRLFNEENVSYLVLGGHAVIAHGYIRTTGDIDIFVSSDKENSRRVVRALIRYGFTKGEFTPEDFTKVPSYISFSRHDGWIDIMNFTLGVSFDECDKNRDVFVVQDVPIRFISLPDLIRNKKATGRPQDLRDLENLPGGTE